MNNYHCMIKSKDSYANQIICSALLKIILSYKTPYQKYVFFCIGTPNVSGDSLGPYIGSCIKSWNLPNCIIYGTWKNPVHALNLADTLQTAKKKHPDSCFIAIDASFGPPTHLGHICIENRPIHPGRGVGKTLPPVGNVSITGIICSTTAKRQAHLEQVPFSYIQNQANPILHGIFQTLFYLFTVNKL